MPSACLEFLKKANEVVQKLLLQSLGGGLLHANMSVVIKRTKEPEFAALESSRLFVFAACRHVTQVSRPLERPELIYQIQARH